MIETIFLTVLITTMIVLTYVGMHMNKPMFWEDGGLIDRLKDKLGL
jgi:hypothetical protein